MTISRSNAMVSIVITCFNQGRYLSDAIGSALAQAYHEREVIIINDGSADETSDVSSRFPQIRYFRQTNRGLAAARNAGIREARGTFLLFLDADDRLLPDAVETNMGLAVAHPDCAFVYGDYRLITSDGVVIERGCADRPESDAYDELLRGNYIGMHGAVLYRRSVFDEVGVFNTDLRACEDYEMYLRIAHQFPFCGHRDVVAEYREHADNMSRDCVLMLNSALAVLNMQEPLARGNRRYSEAIAHGRDFWKKLYGRQLAYSMKSESAPRAIGAACTLLRHDPAAFGRYLVEYCLRNFGCGR